MEWKDRQGNCSRTITSRSRISDITASKEEPVPAEAVNDRYTWKNHVCPPYDPAAAHP